LLDRLPKLGLGLYRERGRLEPEARQPGLQGGFVGKQFTATYSPEGVLVDMTGPPGTEQIVGPLKQMLGQILAQVPQVKLAIGETTTMPMSTPLPLPIPGSKGLEFKGKSTMTLVSIDTDGADRVASCDSVFQGTLDSTQEPSSPGPIGVVAMNFWMTGTGRLQVNIDRRVVKLNENTTTLDGTFSSPGRDGKVGRMRMRGVMKMTVAESR